MNRFDWMPFPHLYLKFLYQRSTIQQSQTIREFTKLSEVNEWGKSRIYFDNCQGNYIQMFLEKEGKN